MKFNDGVGYQEGFLLAERILFLLRTENFLESLYPSLFSQGIPEGSLHAFMLSGFLLLGADLNFSPVSDAPIFNHLDNLLLGESSKRPDSIWYERGGTAIRMLLEFERYQGNAIENKARNLLIMANACREDLHLLSLIYWTEQIRSNTNLLSACNIITKGFTHRGSRFSSANCPFLLLEACVGRNEQRVYIKSFITRHFIYGGGDKPHIVDKLNST